MENEFIYCNSFLNAFLFKVYKIKRGHKFTPNVFPASIISTTNYSLPCIPTKTSVIEKCGLDRLVDVAFKNYSELLIDFKDVSQEELIDCIFDKISKVMSATHKGLISGFKNRIYQKVAVYYPFVRLSLINGHSVITYFFLVEYFSGESEFWFCEEVPDEQQKDYETTKNLHEYMDIIDYQVRSSFVNGKINCTLFRQ